MADTVECPYCLKDCEVNDDDGCTEFDQECEHCGEEFKVLVEYHPSYTGSKITYLTCPDCGRERRNDGRQAPYPRPNKYKSMPDEEYHKVCRKCYWNAVE